MLNYKCTYVYNYNYVQYKMPIYTINSVQQTAQSEPVVGPNKSIAVVVE